VIHFRCVIRCFHIGLLLVVMGSLPYIIKVLSEGG
jgi:hypothetical protein